MSGHSHFKTIKARKESMDAKKGKMFSKFARLITIAAKEGGDPAVNVKLKGAIDQARQFNMPKENIERAVKKGTGELAGESLQEVSFEGFGPGNIALIIEGITDNKNRTLSEVKEILSRFGGKMAGEGAVKWMFEKRGVIIAKKQNGGKEETELLAIESGAEDISWDGEFLTIYTSPDDLKKVKAALETKKIEIESALLGWKEKEIVEAGEKEREGMQKLFEALDENDAVQNIYSNLKD